jgi:hypothetical protein
MVHRIHHKESRQIPRIVSCMPGYGVGTGKWEQDQALISGYRQVESDFSRSYTSFLIIQPIYLTRATDKCVCEGKIGQFDFESGSIRCNTRYGSH